MSVMKNLIETERNKLNVYLMYQVINAVKRGLSDDKRERVDLDNDWPNTVIYSDSEHHFYWFYDVVEGSHIYVHEVKCTKENVDIVLDKEYEFATISALIQHITETIHFNED